jgi:FkbM family methyltransferase
LPRLAKYINKKEGNLIVIDVGANVGDTAALIKSETDCTMACIEGNNKFFQILSKNTKQLEPMSAFNYLITDSDKDIVGSFKDDDLGSARMVISEKGENVASMTLDNFLLKHPDFMSARLLKTDTDGYDFAVVRGGIEYIKKTKPILFLEYERSFMEQAGDDGLSTLQLLKENGYNRIIFYDNYGRFMLSTQLANDTLIKELYYYSDRKKNAIPYYDIVLFHANDDSLAVDFARIEFSLFHPNC